ncbi:MAG TPA: ATP-dependent 6-phosphofructokinase, partial [Planctomycetota bacterium]|nr:ATP-dependent 6-phosphofructokinase [Planctomycetota bacterium]
GDEGIVPLTRDSVRGLLWRGGSILGCNNRYRGDPAFFVERMKEIGLEGLVIVGGEGSLTVAAAMASLGARVVGVPKTIDNDVEGTDQTFGFDTAVSLVADMCIRLIDTAESHHRVMIVEVMGRNAGHIALHGALAGSADISLIPEIPYRIERIAAKIADRAARGRTYTLVVMAEGAVQEGGEKVLDRYRSKLAGREILGGAAEVLAHELRKVLDHEVRSLSLAHLQRGGTPTAFDRVLASRMGVLAARALAANQTNVFTAYRNSIVQLAPLSDAAGKVRRVDAGGRFLSAARALGMSFGD